jgi:hypothetical protein
MSLTYSLNCTIEPLLCSIRNLIQFPLLYLTAAHLLEMALHDQRINSYIINSRESHSVLSKKYKDEYNIMMFGAYNEAGKKIQQGLMDSVSLPHDICFKKNKRLHYNTLIP